MFSKSLVLNEDYATKLSLEQGVGSTYSGYVMEIWAKGSSASPMPVF